MKINKPGSDYINRNVMELLVNEEIERQIERFPSNIKNFINPLEVATYALNRLPALYASSQQGFNKQKLKGKAEYSVQITQEVRKGFAAVQKDILRTSTPLLSEMERNLDADLKEAQEALEELAAYLPEKDLSWKNIVKLVKPLLAELKEQDDDKTQSRIRSRSTRMWDDSGYKKSN
ncbi:late competence development protein ComFB [Chondrocystis sp. NIES-4102]|nr:late competence development protein ComFB [Chondrocystis sp. NIES-4102]